MQLFALTPAGRVLATNDFESWAEVSAQAIVPTPPALTLAGGVPAGTQRITASPQNLQRVFALGRNLYRSEDGGRTWTNISAYGDDSVIGEGQRDVAVSPLDPNMLVVANEFGVWRSNDGGLSWTGLNEYLPNLGVRRILSTPRGPQGVRIAVDRLGVVELSPGGTRDWHPATDPEARNELSVQLGLEAAQKRAYSAALGADITALRSARDTVYAGAADGRIWVSLDRGQTWVQSQQLASGRVENIWTDPQEPRVALAVLGGTGPHVLRTINGGAFWDDITGNLPDAPVHALAVDRSAAAVYVAGERGLFQGSVDLERLTLGTTWTWLGDSLPSSRAIDVSLDGWANQLYVALDGYGVFAAPAPHKARTLRLVNAADFSNRPAAPGSLMSVIGGAVTSAQSGTLNFPVLAASESQSQIQVPFEAAGSSLSLALRAAGRQVTLPLALQNVSPAIFIDLDGSPMLLDADSGLMFDARNTAHSGSRLQILATGLGKVRPDWPTGLAAPLREPPRVVANVTAYLDRQPLQVLRATLAPSYVGFYLVEVQVPALVNAGPTELYIAADGQESNRVQIHLEP